nr:ABC transporter ATP-binding protein [Argonema galeatum]
MGKKYVIGHQQQVPYKTLRESMVRGAKSLSLNLLKPFRKKDPSPAYEEFWALKDVSFEIKQGDRVGIIGRNGAGKSTLLKILSRITEPTTGRICIKGRVASLLEVGTGFHPELTGRENIYLNGAILGMSKVDIKKKFDEIVAFAEVEKFLDTPVKRYSSGMYVRLAFGVAAHLEPEILVVDEVLAVGDAQFQKKCLGKMGEVGKEGRTVLFVSHQMGMLAQLCSEAIFLETGKVIKKGEAKEVISLYLEKSTFNQTNTFIRSDLGKIEKEIYITQAKTVNSLDVPLSEFGHTEQIVLKISFLVRRWIEDVVMGVSLKDIQNRKIFTSQTKVNNKLGYINNHVEMTAKMKIPVKLITPGKYYFTIAFHIPNISIIDIIEEACIFTVVDIGSEFAMYEGGDYGCIFADCSWEM